MQEDITLAEVDEARERTRIERESQGLTLDVTDTSALGPLARSLNRQIEAEAAPSNDIRAGARRGK